MLQKISSGGRWLLFWGGCDTILDNGNIANFFYFETDFHCVTYYLDSIISSQDLSTPGAKLGGPFFKN
ncbi:hypothetical protein AP285_01490 [Limnospira platensis YZ]|nr:hypothetical protein AP285_01490 [Arthrospira platensis YZ]KDR57356.1 hypothetical protein APPUASWS_011550 [Arthrospira platensis str. Paraca]